MESKLMRNFQRKQKKEDQHISGLAGMLFGIFLGIAVLAAVLMDDRVPDLWMGLFVGVMTLIGTYLLFALKVASQWNKAVVLRLGTFHGLRGPGMFWVIPVVDSIASWIDHRVMVTPFAAQKTLTKDTVPVDVDAVLFWVVWDAEKAALEVENYRGAVDWAAQTALRDIIGRMMLADILVGRSVIDQELQQIIDERTTPWGVTVNSVEIRDIVIPQDLEDAMSRQAQAERERQARVILGESEKQIAASFAEAAQAYQDNPTALHLRAMNMLFEGLKQKGALVIVPSSAVDTMNLGAVSGIAAIAQNNLPTENK
ncbi:MAG TPA: slipin family protein [Anaerolineales bacterium]|jgi:regulator of protease activity HflC (stomatin/prohibitin superfamily)|nr:slipin family protein [Anaerolineales bacterium]